MRDFLIIAAAFSTIGLVTQAPVQPPAGPGMTLTTTAFENAGIIPSKYTMSAMPAAAVSPKLDWMYVPEGTVSFALILHDPDNAPGRLTEDTLHWMIFQYPGSR